MSTEADAAMLAEPAVPSRESGATLPPVGRICRGVLKRVRLAMTRLRHRRARFGARCDVRSRFRLRQDAGARVVFGDGCILDNDLTVEVQGTLTVGRGTIFGHHCTVAARDRVEIGEDCMLAELVSVRDHDHNFDRLDVPYRQQGMRSAPVRLGRNVWVGCKVTITRGVTIGDNAIIGANAVVTRDVPANAVAAGVPAKVLRVREG